MRFVIAGCLSVAIAVAVSAQQPPQQQPPRLPDPVPPANLERPSTTSGDPRIGLKAGIHDAGEAAKNLERIASLGKPDGFYDPKQPAGSVTPAEQPGSPAQPERPPFDPVASNRLDFTNSDLAFKGHHVIMGSYHGFNTYDVERPKRPKLLASVVCPGGQGDVSVHGNLLVMSVEQTRGRLDCGTQGVQTAVSS
jgi:hypothetical protein